MTDADQKLDDAKAALQAATPAKRTKDPAYHVFEQTSENTYRMLTTTTGEHASSRQEAIKRVARTPAADDSKPRTYLVMPAKEFKLLTRKTRVETVEEWA